MGWGSSIAKAYQAATDTAKAAASKAAQTAQSAYDYVENKGRQAVDAAEAGYDYTKQKAGEAYDYGKQKAAEGYAYGKHKTEEAYQYGKQRALDAYDYGKEKAGEARDWAKGRVRDAKLGAIQSRYESARKSLGQEIAGSSVKMCPKVAAQCGKLKDARNKAELSADTYNNAPPPGGKKIGGYRRLDPDDPKDADELRRKLGVTKDDLEPEGSDFRARVYAKTVNGKTEYVIGYRGTQTGADWKENVRQGSGMVDATGADPNTQSSYNRAVRLAKKAAEKTETNGDLLSYTGHSLGGGMASAASAMTSAQGVTHTAANLQCRWPECQHHRWGLSSPTSACRCLFHAH